MREVWLSVEQYAELRDISPQAVRKALRKAWHSKASGLTIRQVRGRGGRSGQRYEVLLSSLSAALQDQFRSTSEPSDTALLLIRTPSPKFIAALNQTEEERRKFAVLRLIADTKPRTSERRRAIEEASRHHAVPVRTIERWVKRCDEHGWDMDAMGRKKPENSNGPRIFVSREFDNRWRAAGLAEDDLAELGEWVTRKLAGWWQSPVQRAGWKRVRLETLTDLQRHCRERGLSLPRSAFHLSRRRVEELRFHSIVDVMANDAKRFDDMKPRIRRNNALFEPMAQVVMDVKPLDCEMLRPDGTVARPKFIAFLDTGTMRITGRVLLLPKGEGVRQEHVTDAFIGMAANPDWGFPQQLYRDNGTEYLHFDLIREALKMTAAEGVRVIINAKPYSGASKPIESRSPCALPDIHQGLRRGRSSPNLPSGEPQMQAFPALSDIPATCLALPIASLDIAAADRFGAGDCIVIDVASTELEDGALYLRRFGPNTSHSSLSVWRAELRYTRGELRWWLFGRGPFASDGPYLVDDVETRSYLSQSIVGRVVGCVSKTVDAASVFPPAFAALAAESQSGAPATCQQLAHPVPGEAVIAL